MNKIQYLLYLKENLEQYAHKNKLRTHSEVTIDWGEMQFLLGFITQTERNTMNNKHIPVSDNLSSNINCNRCESGQMQEYQQQDNQIQAYRWFLREHRLEEDFEYFCLDKGELP